MYSKLPLDPSEDARPRMTSRAFYSGFLGSIFSVSPKRVLFRNRLLIFLATVVSLVFGAVAYHRHYARTYTVINRFIASGSVQTPVQCPIPSKAPFNISDPTYNSRLYDANNAYKLGSLDLDEYYNELVQFMPSQESNIRHFLKPSQQSFLTGSTKSENSKHQIPPYIWQTGKTSIEKLKNKNLIIKMRSWVNQTVAPFYDTEHGGWNGGWKYARLVDRQLREMWPSNLDVLLHAAEHRPVILSDSWRLLITSLKGGVYADIDTELLKPITRWWTDTRFGTCDPDYTAPSLIISIERENIWKKEPWYIKDARPLQIVQWAFAAAEGHPVVVDALRRVTHNVEDYLAHNSEDSLRTMKPAKVLRVTGPGPFTDAVLRYLAAKHGMHWWDLINLAGRTSTTAMQVGDVLILPRIAFNPRDIMRRSAMNAHESVCLDHSFAGSWRKIRAI